MADVLEGRRGSPWLTVCRPGEPFVTAVQRICDFAVNYSPRRAVSRPFPMAGRCARTAKRSAPPLRNGAGPREGPAGSLRAQVPGALDAAQPQLHVQPFTGPGDLPFARDVLTTQGVVCLASAASAHRHPPVRLGGMVLVESSSNGHDFGRDHDSPHRRPIMADAKPEGATHARMSRFRPSVHPTAHPCPGLTPRHRSAPPALPAQRERG